MFFHEKTKPRDYAPGNCKSQVLLFLAFNFFIFNINLPSQFSVSMETTVFGAGLGMCVLVVVFFLYMNRKWCFSNTSGNFPCCDEKSLSTKTIHSFSKYKNKIIRQYVVTNGVKVF